ncbi:nitroreductase family protein [Mycoplasma marinum]|uniref:Nitroreductase domain-containing protein n=1 Tax=Mycoplasma marinum TaxID=1937190 RepID=A0A4R0XJY1_9MOLU|nr:nitroreductase family protein [Mycoplasma marinum]TCG10943.1 hypothetical protein C4B24_03480 [Mycoplasma marinum]
MKNEQNNFIEKQLNRRSERNLNKEKIISKEDVQLFKDVVSSAPTSKNGQGATAIFIQDKDMIAKIAKWNWNQVHITQAQLVVLFVGDMNRVKYIFEKNGNPEWELNEGNFHELLLIGAVDATIKGQALTDAALSKGMGSCYIGGVRTFPEKLIEELELPPFVIPIVGLTVGYPDTQEEIKPKLNTVYDEKYNNEQMKEEVDAYDEVMSKYFTNRGRNRKDITWSADIAYAYQTFFDKDLYGEQYKLMKRKYKGNK